MTPERAYIIHGYLSYPEEAWLPWLKRELEARGYAVSLPAMPNPDRPMIPVWIDFITKLVGVPDQRTTLIGHSMGCQAVLRYLETLGDSNQAVKKTILVAGNFPSGMALEEAQGRAEDHPAMIPWLTTVVDARKVKKASGQCTVILADNDSYINVDRAAAAFRANLDARVIIEHGKGHFNEDDKVTELPSALDAVISKG